MSMITLSSKLTIVLLLLIIILAGFFRIYKLDQVPAALMWDEVAVGYNAWSIANFGKDEWGNTFPLAFKSFGEYKLPIHIYTDALVIKLFGLSDFTTRLPTALLGIVNVILIFFLGRVLLTQSDKNFSSFKSNLVGLFAALFLALSPYNLHFSRMNHEANFALFFFMLGLLMFHLGIFKKNYLLPVSFIFFGLCVLSYNASKVFIPLFIMVLLVFYWKQLLKLRKLSLISLIIAVSFIGLIFTNPGLSGGQRAQQTFLGDNEIKETYLYKIAQNKFLGIAEVITNKYLLHFSWNFLFITGDPNPRLGSQVSGQFFKSDLALIILGLIFLFIKKSKEGWVILAWVLISPIPASITAEAPHAGRAMFMMGSLNIISSLGIYWLLSLIRNKYFKVVVVALLVIFLTGELNSYFYNYYHVFSKNYGTDWQYGMKQSVDYVNEYPVFDQVYVTAERAQPYIFFLNYLKVPPDELKKTVKYNKGLHQSSNLILSFGKYHFGDWNIVDSEPKRGILYVLTPSEYDGLKYKSEFNIMEQIKNPNGTDAFYLVEGKH